MTSRVHVIMACLPLALALIVIAVASSFGRTSYSLLSENYRNALAGQRMKDELDQFGRATYLAASGLRDRALAQESSDEKAFASDLSIQETTIREPHAAQIVATLRQQWTEYQLPRAPLPSVRSCFPSLLSG